MSKLLTWSLVAVAAGAGTWFFFLRRKDATVDIEYRYAAVSKGEIVRSITATGQVTALTTVDVKSKAGGKIVRLAVEEGDAVRRGDLIAIIDPADTQAIYEQASAEVRGALARAEQARINAQLSAKTSDTAVRDAEVALQLARLRLERITTQSESQPALSRSELDSARASLAAQRSAERQLEDVTIPQQRRDAQAAVDRTRAERDAALAEVTRQRELLAKGYVSVGAAERALSQAEAARTAYLVAEQRLSTLEQDLAAQIKSQRARVAQAEAALLQAEANQSRVQVTRKDVEEARQMVRMAELALERARNERLTIDARRSDVTAAEAATVRSRVAMQNARVQLESTTVVAPRDGVVTLKYLEEGTIIPPGTSTFAQGTSIVQISDVTRVYVETGVDESDIGAVRVGQAVRVVVEAYPRERLRGVVRRINPAAQTVQNITNVGVQVEVLPGQKVKLLPGMTASCEFIIMSKPDVLIVPAQALQREGDKTFVRVKGPDPKKPIRREVKTGEAGNDGIVVLSGLEEKEEVVVAEIDLNQLRETQRRMEEAMRGGGLAGAPTGPGSGRGGRSMGGAGAGGAGRGGR
jgi:HlyD family secretion protein